MTRLLSNKKVLITGASSGIGAATAREFAKYGASVLLIARNEGNLKKVADEIIFAGGNAVCFPCDISDFEEVKNVSEKIKSEIGVPDIIVNNAGQGKWKFIEETEYSEVAEMMAVPYFGAFYITKAFLPEMIERNSGHIVNMTSYAGFIAFSGATAYIAARTAMVGFNNALAADLHKTKIKISLAYFAKVKSDYWQNNPGSEERLPASQVLIPAITPQKAAKAIVSGVIKNRKRIFTPFMILIMNGLIRFLPFIARLIMNKTGYSKKLS